MHYRRYKANLNDPGTEYLSVQINTLKVILIVIVIKT